MNLRLRHFVFAALLHLSLLLLLLTGAQCSPHLEAPGSIQGVLISSDQLSAASKKALPPPPVPVPPQPDDVAGQATREAEQKQLDEEKIKQEAQEAQQKQQQEAEAQQAEQQKRDEQQKADAAKAEAKKQADILQKQADDRAALQRAADLKQQADAEQKRIEDQKKAEEQKKLDEKKQADARKAAEAAADQKRLEDLQKQQFAEETKRLADLEKKKKDEAARRAAVDRMAKDDMAAQMGAEEKSRAQAAWATQVAAAIRLRHNPPASTSAPSYARIVLSATGDVISATTVRSSGNPQYDDSVVRAALAASPLPLPTDMAAFDPRITVCLPAELCPK